MTATQPQRISEMQNELTETIDAALPRNMLEMLKQTEEQIFEGWNGYPTIFSERHMRTLLQLESKATDMLQDNIQNKANNVFVFSGCGTSGRIAWLCSRAFNLLLRQHGIDPCFKYVISGGDESLIVCNEIAEDDPPEGIRNLADMTIDNKSVLYFGITCGLSAPYVAGQIDYAMLQENITPVLVGYNPISLARDKAIEKWPGKTCRQEFFQLEEEAKKDRGFILNPIIGPEPITGSTRMKGGSTTKILLETIFLSALNRALHLSKTSASNVETGPGKGLELKRHDSSEISKSVIPKILEFYWQAVSAAYGSACSALASMISTAGDCLRKPGAHMYYIGADTFGLIGLVDGAEMLDTFGASVDDVRGFVKGGWATCHNACGNIGNLGNLFRISTEQFESDILPSLTVDDIVVLLGSEVASSHLIDQLILCPVQLARISIAVNDSASPCPVPESRYCAHATLVPHRWPDSDKTQSFALVKEVEQLGQELMVKVALCAVSTGVNILIGRVYGNVMINLTVANDKLFYRSTEIISQLSKSSVDVSRAALLSAIYGTETLTDEIDRKPVSEHVLAALHVKMVVPTAILLATKQAKTVAEAKLLIQSTTSIRLLMQC